jgi:hypothetical protein
MSEITYASVGSICKSWRDDQGVLHFEASKATGPELDMDEQIADPDWAKRAMEGWFRTGGNLREQHSHIAAGKALTLEHRADGQYISGKVVDPGSARKVEQGVLTGLSIGIKGARVVKDAAASNGKIVGGVIVEVSLVDRPCLPTAKLVLAKADGAGKMQIVNRPVYETAAAKAAELRSTIARLSKSATGMPVASSLATSYRERIAELRRDLAEMEKVLSPDHGAGELRDRIRRFEKVASAVAPGEAAPYVREILELKGELTELLKGPGRDDLIELWGLAPGGPS